MKKETIIAYKGFNKDLKCRDFQYEIGSVYEMPEDGIKVCKQGFRTFDPSWVLNHRTEIEAEGRALLERRRQEKAQAEAREKNAAFVERFGYTPSSKTMFNPNS